MAPNDRGPVAQRSKTAEERVVAADQFLMDRYCHWNGATKSFDVCPYRGMEGYATGHNFNGEANFDHTVVEVSGNALRVDFVKPYAGEPLCWVSFENEWVHHRMDTFTLGVRIFLANTDGTDRDWSTVTSYMQIVCHGSGLDRVYSGSFGMPSGIVVPSANSDLDKAFQLSGICKIVILSRIACCPSR